MKRWLLFLLLLIFGFIVVTSRGIAAVDCTTERCATCDLCGYCWQMTPTPPVNNPPSNWVSCQKCLYPHITGEPLANESLKVSDENIPVTPYPGRWFTGIGCIGTSASSFSEPGAAGDVIQFLLTKVVFSVVGGIAFLYLIYGAFLILTSQSEPEKLNHGKRIIYGAVVGLIFSLSSVFLINLIASGILKIPGFG